MHSIQNPVEKSLVRWLLEEENPSIRYFTLRDVLDKPEDALELQAAKAAIFESTPSGRMQANIETRGKPSKWITLIALRVLRRLQRLNDEEVKER